MTRLNQEENITISEIPESYQRYLDEIYRIARRNKGGWVSNKELKDNLRVEPASVSGMLHKLEDKGLINWKPRQKIRLTDLGKSLAMQLDETHELLRLFFEKVLQIRDKVLVENVSCEIEHHLTGEVKESFKKFLLKYLEE
ncbi:MAG: metal-dependent transcriptional regulator [Promethearchaeota archaeon]